MRDQHLGEFEQLVLLAVLRPVTAGTGIPVSSIYERYKAGDSVADLAQDFRLEIGAIEEAIRCQAA